MTAHIDPPRHNKNTNQHPHTMSTQRNHALALITIRLMLVVAIIASCFVVACQKTEDSTSSSDRGQLHGQVFIATQGGQSVKLALTDITLYKPSDIELAQSEYRKGNEEREVGFKQRDEETAAKAEALKRELADLQTTYSGREDSPEVSSKISVIKLKFAALQL